MKIVGNSAAERRVNATSASAFDEQREGWRRGRSRGYGKPRGTPSPEQALSSSREPTRYTRTLEGRDKSSGRLLGLVVNWLLRPSYETSFDASLPRCSHISTPFVSPSLLLRTSSRTHIYTHGRLNCRSILYDFIRKKKINLDLRKTIYCINKQECYNFDLCLYNDDSIGVTISISLDINFNINFLSHINLPRRWKREE